MGRPTRRCSASCRTGVPAVDSLPPDVGRALGAKQVVADEFKCLGYYSDAGPGQCPELDFMVDEGPELTRAFKTPSLRNVAIRPPYMHAGQIETLADVIVHYDRAPRSPLGSSEIRPLGLSPAERKQLEAFLLSLSGPLDVPATLLAPPR